MKIAGIDYTVDYLPSESVKHLGLADFNRQRILINKDSTISTQRIALCHEIIHILDKVYLISLSEEQVIKLTHAIVALHAENPQLKLGE